MAAADCAALCGVNSEADLSVEGIVEACIKCLGDNPNGGGGGGAQANAEAQVWRMLCASSRCQPSVGSSMVEMLERKLAASGLNVVWSSPIGASSS